MSDSQSPNEYSSREKKTEGYSRTRTSRNADKSRKKIRHVWDAHHAENDDDYYLSSGTHIHTNVLSETYPKEYSVVSSYSLSFDDEDDFKDAHPANDRLTASSISPSILGLSGSIGFSSSDKEEFMSHEEHGDALVREEQFLDIPDSPKLSPVSRGHRHPGARGSHPVSESHIPDSPGPHQFLECIACSSWDDCIALETNPALRRKLQSNGTAQKSLNGGKVFLICGTSPSREETKVSRKSSKHIDDGTKVSRKSSKHIDDGTKVSRKSSNIDEPVLQDHYKQSSIHESPHATRSRKIQVRPHTDKSTQFTPTEGEDEQPRDIRDPQVVRSKSISADDGFRYKEDQTAYDRQRPSTTDQRNENPKGRVLRREPNSTTNTEQNTHQANLSKRDSLIQSSRVRTYSLNTFNEIPKSMTAVYNPYGRLEPILPHLSSRYGINTGSVLSIENKNSQFASRTQIPYEYGRHEPILPYSSSRYGMNTASRLSVENKNLQFASRTQIPHLMVGGEYRTLSSLPNSLKQESNPPLMNNQILQPQSLWSMQMPRQDPVINYQMSSSQPTWSNQIFQPQPIINNNIPTQQPITNNNIPTQQPITNNNIPTQQPITNIEIPPHRPVWNNSMSLQNPNMNNLTTQPQPNTNNQLSQQYPNMNNQLSPEYPNMNNQLSPQYPNMNNQISPQYPNMNNQLSPQYPNMNNQLSPQYPNMNNQLSPQYPNMNNQLSPQYPNMNNQLSPQYPDMNNQLSPQYPNMNNQLSPQYPNMNNQLSPQYANINNQPPTHYPSMNNPMSRQYSCTNNQLCQPQPTLAPQDHTVQCPRLNSNIELNGGNVSNRDLCGYSLQMAYGDTGNQGFKGSNQSSSKSYPFNSSQTQRPVSQTTCVPRVQFQETPQHIPNALICGNRQENANTMTSPIDACDSDPLQDFSSTSSYPSGRLSRFQTFYSGECGSHTTKPNQSIPRLSQQRRGQLSASPSHIPDTFTNMPAIGSESQSYFSAQRKQPYYMNRGHSPRQHRRNNFEAPQHFNAPNSCDYQKGNDSPIGCEDRYLMKDPMVSVQDGAHYAKRSHLTSVSRHSSRSFCRGNDDRGQSSSDESLNTPRCQRYVTLTDDVDDVTRGPARRRNMTYQLRSRPGRVSNSKSCYDNMGGWHGSDKESCYDNGRGWQGSESCYDDGGGCHGSERESCYDDSGGCHGSERESCYDNGRGWQGSDRESCYDNSGGWIDSERERCYDNSGGYLGSGRDTFDNDRLGSDTRSCYNNGGGWKSKNKPARKRFLSEGYSEYPTPRFISRSSFGIGDYRVVDRHFSTSASKTWDKYDSSAPVSWSFHSECPGMRHSPPLRQQSYQAPSSPSSRRSSRGDVNEDDDDGKSSWASDE